MELNDHAPRQSRWRERERQRAREEILTAASTLFAQFGFEKTSMKQIADQAELSVGMLYNHFPGKKEIFRELLERYIEELITKSDQSCRPDDHPLEQLRCRLKASIKHCTEHRNLVLIYLNENSLKIEGVIREKLRNYRNIFAGLITRAVERGEITAEDPYVVTDILTGALHKLLHTMAENGSEEKFDAIPEILDRIILKPLELRRNDASRLEEY